MIKHPSEITFISSEVEDSYKEMYQTRLDLQKRLDKTVKIPFPVLLIIALAIFLNILLTWS